MKRAAQFAMLLCFVGSLSAQNAAPPAAATPAAPATVPAAPAAAPVSVDEAYRKEFAFLSAQKRELSAQLAQLKSNAAQQQNSLNAEVGALESRVLALDNESGTLQEQAIVAEETSIANEETSSLLEATFAQASATLEGYGVELLKTDAFAQSADADKTTQLFSAAGQALAALSTVRSEAGEFFLADGTQVKGKLLRVGNIAVYGISEQGSGALAPAGGGQLKLWRDPADDIAKALEAGQTPAVLKTYLFESAANAVAEPKVENFFTWMGKGGPIGYITIGLGFLAGLFALLRAFFLLQAGAAVQPIIDSVTPLLKQRKITEAIEACKRHKGSAARVVTAALRNLDREREHLEDIISESILHESTRLNRFGSVILMIAGVAPLLGLLGTVTGMIQTFDVITEFGTSDPKLLAGGIAVALVTTEQGLLVAIPCLLVGNLLSGWADRIKDDMEKGALKVINLFQEQRDLAKAA